VAESGVVLVASGVVKALADVVHIAGCDGGTGASPLSSIKNAGLPWELGLAETQNALVNTGLRGRVRLRVDGGLKTGRDLVVGALLGADEFSFGTALLLAEGCLMVRSCHLDTCPVGIATQRPELRSKFAATPEQVEAYLFYVAEEVRELLASLGLRSLGEAVGRVDLLRQRARGGRADLLDTASLLARAGEGPASYAGEPVLLGNTVLYGATGGELFCAGRAGERFAVRNSGAVAVVEGAGDHPCEYMTNGTVVILGETGRNLGAGMSGGQVYVYDPAGVLDLRLNDDLVMARPVEGPAEELRRLLERHVRYTGSPRASELLKDWATALESFVRVSPKAEVARLEDEHEGTLGLDADVKRV